MRNSIISIMRIPGSIVGRGAILLLLVSAPLLFLFVAPGAVEQVSHHAADVSAFYFSGSDTSLVEIKGDLIDLSEGQELLLIVASHYPLSSAATSMDSYLRNSSLKTRLAVYADNWPDVEFHDADSMPVDYLVRAAAGSNWQSGPDELERLKRTIELWPNIEKATLRSIVIFGASEHFKPDRELNELCMKHLICISIISPSAERKSLPAKNMCELTGGLLLEDTDIARAFAKIYPIRSFNPVITTDAGATLVQISRRPWTGTNPILCYGNISGARTLFIRDGDKPAAAIPLSPNIARDSALPERCAFALLESWRRRADVSGLSSDEMRFLDLLADDPLASANAPLRRFRAETPQALMELLTGRIAIDESLQTDIVLASDARPEASIAVSALRPPPLHHLDYESMVASRTVTDFPLSTICPADMMLLSFASVDDAFAFGDFCDYWSSDLGRIFLEEMGSGLFRSKLLDRLAVKIDARMRPFYSLAVAEFGFIVNEPSLASTQDIAMVMKPRRAEMIRERFAQYRAEFMSENPSAIEKKFVIGSDEVISLVTPGRRISSYAVFRDDIAILATSRRTLERILETADGRAPALAKEADIRLLASTLTENDGVIAVSEKFIGKIIGPAWRIKAARRNACFTNLERLEQERTFERAYWPRASSNRSGRAPACAEGDTYAVHEGEFVCPVHGSLEFATPLDEIELERVTTAEASAYRNFAEQYQRYWSRAIDPIGISFTRNGDKIDFHTLILPLIDQSEYRSLQRIIGTAETPELEEWSTFPSSTALLLNAHNPAAKWLRGEDDAFGDEWRLGEARQREELGLRADLNWPKNQPLFGWLGDEFGFFMSDASPDALDRFSRNARETGVPVGVFVSVRDEGRAARFLHALSQSRRAAGLRVVDRARNRFAIDDFFGMRIHLGVADGRLVASLDPRLIEPARGARLSSTPLDDVGGDLAGAGQMMALVNLDEAPKLVDWFGRTFLFPLEAEECRRARREKADGECPFGGTWIRGAGDMIVCERHEMSPARFPSFTMNPSVDAKFPLALKLAKLHQAGISLKLTPDGLEAHFVVTNPTAPPPSFLEFFSSMRGVGIIGILLFVMIVGLAAVVILLRERRRRNG